MPGVTEYDVDDDSERKSQDYTATEIISAMLKFQSGQVHPNGGHYYNEFEDNRENIY